MAPMWKKLMKHDDFEEPTSFLDHAYLGCTQRECKPNEIIIEEFTKIAGASEKLPGCEKPHAKTVAWSYDMEGHSRKCVERYCELVNEKMEQLYKVSSLYIDDHQFKQEEHESVGEISPVCSKKCIEMLVFGTNLKTRHFRGRLTSLQDQSQNGLRHVTDDWQD